LRNPGWRISRGPKVEDGETKVLGDEKNRGVKKGKDPFSSRRSLKELRVSELLVDSRGKDSDRRLTNEITSKLKSQRRGGGGSWSVRSEGDEVKRKGYMRGRSAR